MLKKIALASLFLVNAVFADLLRPVEAVMMKPKSVDVTILLDNLSYKQPMRGLCLAVSTTKQPDVSFSDLIEGKIWIDGAHASDGLGSFAQDGNCDPLIAEMMVYRFKECSLLYILL